MGPCARIDRGQGLFRPRPHRDIFRQVHPPHRSRAIDVKLGWSRDVAALWSGMRMQNIVTANYIGLLIGQKRESESHFPAMPRRHINRVHADRREMDTPLLEITQPLLKTPQLGVAERSPVSAIKDQHRAVWRKQVRERDLFTIPVREREFWRFCSDPRCLR